MSLNENTLRWIGEKEDKYLFCVIYEDEDNKHYTFIDTYEDAIIYYNKKNTQKNYIKLYKIGEREYSDMLKGKYK